MIDPAEVRSYLLLACGVLAAGVVAVLLLRGVGRALMFRRGGQGSGGREGKGAGLHAALIVLAITGAARAQATQPVKVQAPPIDATVGDLRQMVVDLQRKLVALQAENASLRNQLAAATEAAKPPAPTAPGRSAEVERDVADAIANHRLTVGMTVDEARQAMGRAGKHLEKDESGGEVYSWDAYAPGFMSPDRRTVLPAKYLYTVVARFQGGTIVSLRRNIGEDLPPPADPKPAR